MLNYITWDVDPEIIDGWKTPNLYGLLFVTGLIIGYFVIKRVYKKEEIRDEHLDKLVLYMIIATIVGARLGHVLFYGPYFGPDGYFSNPLSILKVWEGGLASHGGAIAILIALYYYSKKIVHKPMLWILDRIAAPIAIAGTFIRLGNLVNSEIVGNPTDVPWAFIFVNFEDNLPRHPAQLYEALAYLLIFGVLMYLYWKRHSWKKPGMLFGIFLILLFGARFLIEFVKIGQAERDAFLPVNTGQILSIPFVLLGAYILFRALKKAKSEETA